MSPHTWAILQKRSYCTESGRRTFANRLSHFKCESPPCNVFLYFVTIKIQEIYHYLIISRERLILTQSVLPCPHGRIFWSTPCRRLMMRECLYFALRKSFGSQEISRALGMDFPMPTSFWWSTDTMTSMVHNSKEYKRILNGGCTTECNSFPLLLYFLYTRAYCAGIMEKRDNSQACTRLRTFANSSLFTAADINPFPFQKYFPSNPI